MGQMLVECHMEKYKYSGYDGPGKLEGEVAVFT